ncbi:MAG: RNA methyltransferase [Proteobacteria bacterium]|nr:MAG: RNA methyltransferase [Pseudomonadota bacterium]
MVDKSRIKYINSLGDKKLRDDDGVFIAEGPKIINELLGENLVEVIEVFATEEWFSQQKDTGDHQATIVDEKMLGRLSFLSTPNQVIGLFKKPSLPPLQLKGSISIIADNIQDPGNLGTIIRCADWFGIPQVVCSLSCADVFNPKTVQATMGSVARVKVYYENLPGVLNGVALFMATLHGKDIRSLPPISEGAIVIGNESKGISSEVLALPHEKITITRKGKAESLNAAMATGIILSHIIR